MSRYRLSTFSLVLPTRLELCLRPAYWNEDGIISGHSSPNCCFCRGSTDLVLICGESHAVLRGTSPDYGSWSKWAHSSLGSRSLCLGQSALPLPCENRRLSMGSRRDIFFLPVRSYRRSIWVSVLAPNLLVQKAQHAASPVGEISLLVVQRAQHGAPPVGESFSPGSTKSSACSPTCRGIFLSW